MKAMALIGALIGVLLTAGCASYEPQGLDRSRPSYQADLESCQDTGPAEVNARNAKTGFRWLTSPFRRTFQIRTAIRSCMDGKGYRVPS